MELLQLVQIRFQRAIWRGIADLDAPLVNVVVDTVGNNLDQPGER